jgi:hypothetical protein
MALLAVSIGIVLDNLRISEKSRLNLGIWLLALCSLGGFRTFCDNAELTLDSFTGDSTHKYFMGESKTEADNQAVIDVINANNFTNIGVYEYYNEYILWAKVSNLQRLECVNLTNAYSVYEDMSYVPECIVWETDEEENLVEELECHGVTYELVWVYPGVDWAYYGLYTPKE